jgi:quercetin dioxygenase-like cupin family protein
MPPLRAARHPLPRPPLHVLAVDPVEPRFSGGIAGGQTMKPMTLTPFALAAVLAGAPAAAQDAAAEPGADAGPGAHLVFRSAAIEWKDGPPSLERGARVAVLEGNPAEPGYFAVRLHLPDGFRIAPHWHPQPERLTVISGTFRLGMGESFDADATDALEPGTYVAMPPGMRHFAVAQGDTVVQLTSIGPWQINYVDPADDPRKCEPEKAD